MPTVTTGPRPWLGSALVVTGALAFSCDVIFAKYLFASGSDPLTMIMVRSVGMTSLLALLLVSWRQPLRLPGRERWISVSIGALFTLQGVCFFNAIELIPVSVGTLIEHTYPFQVALLARFLFGERLGALRLCMIVAALSGLVLVLQGPAAGADLNRAGLLLMVAASGLVTIQILLSHRVLLTVDSRRLTLHLSATVAVFSSAAFLATPLEPRWPQAIVGWVMLALIPVANLIGFLGLFTGLSLIGPGRAAMLANSEPIFLLLLSALLLGERLTAIQIAGAAMVVCAIVLFQLDRAEKAAR